MTPANQTHTADIVIGTFFTALAVLIVLCVTLVFTDIVGTRMGWLPCVDSLVPCWHPEQRLRGAGCLCEREDGTP